MLSDRVLFVWRESPQPSPIEMRGLSSVSLTHLIADTETNGEAGDALASESGRCGASTWWQRIHILHWRKADPMNISRTIVLTGVVTLAVFALGSAGAAAVAHTLTIEDRTGATQKIAPVTTGMTNPSPSPSVLDDKSLDPTGTTTVRPADPVYVDDHGDAHPSGTDDGVAHDLGEGTGASHDSSSGTGESEGSTSGTGRSGDTGSSGDSGSPSGSGAGGGSDDTGGHR